MPMSDDDFKTRLQALGLDTEDRNQSQPDISSIPDPEQSDAPAGEQNPGVGYQGSPDQEKPAELEAATPEEQDAALKMGMPPMNPTPSAQVASSDRDDTGDDEGEDSNPAATTTSASIRMKGMHPTVAQYLSNKQNASMPSPQAAADLSGTSDADILAAQDQMRNRRLASGLGQAFEGLARSGSNTKVDNEFYQNMDKNAASGVQNILDRRKAQAEKVSGQINKLKLDEALSDNDGNSPAAKVLAGLYKKQLSNLGYDPNAIDGLSPRQQKDFVQKVVDNANSNETRKQNAQMMAMYRKDQMDRRQDKMDQDKSYKNAQMQDKISKQVNMLTQSSRNAIGQSGRILVSADRALDILNNPKVTPEDFNSVASDISNMVSGSSTVAGANDQKYKTLQGDLAMTLQKVSSDPQNVNSPELKDHMRQIIGQMRSISAGTARRNLHFVEVSHPQFASDNPDYFENIAKSMADTDAPGSLGLEAQNINPGSVPTTQPVVPSQATPAQAKGPNEVKRLDRKTGKTAIFDADTKQFLRYE